MSALAAGIAATSALISGYAAYKQNQKQNRENMALQNRYNRENWSMQNRYNSPEQQMARLKAAGLNPNLIYQNGGANIGAGEIASPQSMDVQAPDYTAAISHGINAYQASIQADSVQSAIDLNRATTLGIMRQNELLDTPIGKLTEYNALSNQEKETLAKSYGMNVSTMENLSGRFISVMNEVNQKKLNTRQVQLMNDKIQNEKDIAFQQLLQAMFTKNIIEMQSGTEAKIRGWKSDGFDVYLDENSVDYAAKQVIELYENARFGNSNIGRFLKFFGGVANGIGSLKK